MISFSKTAVTARLAIPAVAALVLSACAVAPEPQNAGFDPAAVQKIRFEFGQPEAPLGHDLPLQDISRQVAENLAGWGYPVSDQEPQSSHDMTVTVKKQIRSSTPVGFSFSAGNSDPRSPDFQKADVLPITCHLSPAEGDGIGAELTLEVMADDYLTLQKEPKSLGQTVALLTDDISTSCYNLLSSLRVGRQTVKGENGATVKPGWVPEIRIEIENPGEEAEEGAFVDPSATDATPSSNAPRKRIIIHNEGTPVIFKFGHERK